MARAILAVEILFITQTSARHEKWTRHITSPPPRASHPPIAPVTPGCESACVGDEAAFGNHPVGIQRRIMDSSNEKPASSGRPEQQVAVAPSGGNRMVVVLVVVVLLIAAALAFMFLGQATEGTDPSNLPTTTLQ